MDLQFNFNSIYNFLVWILINFFLKVKYIHDSFVYLTYCSFLVGLHCNDDVVSKSQTYQILQFWNLPSYRGKHDNKPNVQSYKKQNINTLYKNLYTDI